MPAGFQAPQLRAVVEVVKFIVLIADRHNGAVAGQEHHLALAGFFLGALGGRRFLDPLAAEPVHIAQRECVLPLRVVAHRARTMSFTSLNPSGAHTSATRLPMLSKCSRTRA